MTIIDFETYSEADLKLIGSWEYSLHKSTEIYCMMLSISKTDEPTIWKPEDRVFPWAHFLDNLIEAHNVSFERAIWENIMVPRYGAPIIKPEQWRCSMAKCAARGIPLSLAQATMALGLDEQKDSAGKRLMLAMCRPRKPSKNDSDQSTTWWRRQDDLDRLYEYCRQDVRAERALSAALPDLSPHELQVWQVDQEINHRGVAIDRKLAKAALDVAEQATELAVAEAVGICTSGAFTTLGQRDRILGWINEKIKAQYECVVNNLCAKYQFICGSSECPRWATGHGKLDPCQEQVACPIKDEMATEVIPEFHLMAKLDKQAVAETLARKDLPDDVRRVLELKQQVSFASTKKYARMLAASESDGRIRDTLVYCGAHTGRWTGRGTQPQNLKRSGVENTGTLVACITDHGIVGLQDFYPEVSPVEAVSWALRGAFVAAPDHDLIAVDYGAIEARILAWLCDQYDALALLAEGVSLYVNLAEQIFNRKVEKPSHEYDVGKRAILGLGYGMGAKKFVENCATFGVTISEEFAKGVVDTYRERYSEVTRAWYEAGRAAMWAMRHKGESICCQKRIRYKRVKYGLLCRLPSGRVMTYNSARLEIRKTPWRPEGEEAICYQTMHNGQWVWRDMYAGKFIQHVCQASARDIMAYAVIRLSETYIPVMTVHDEIVTEVPEGQGSIDGLKDIMLDVPKWARSIPLDADGWRGKRYRK